MVLLGAFDIVGACPSLGNRRKSIMGHYRPPLKKGDRVRVLRGNYPHLVGKPGWVSGGPDRGGLYSVDFYIPGRCGTTAFFLRAELARVPCPRKKKRADKS